jgi:hypothetical protein
MRDLLEAAAGEVLAIDALDSESLAVVDHRDRELAPGAVAITNEPVAVARAAGDTTLADTVP